MEKTLWGWAGKYQLRLPQRRKAGPGRAGMGDPEPGMGRCWEHPQSPRRGSAPIGQRTPHPSGCSPQSLCSDVSSLLLGGEAEAVEGKCSNLARKDFLRWRLRPRCCDLWGLAQPRLHPHTHAHMSHPQVSQPFYPRTFGLGILFWCLGSPARMAEPTIAAVCSTAHPKKTAHLLHHPSCTRTNSPE